MLVSKVPMRRAVSMISVLSIPIRGRSTGRSWAASVQRMAWTVWLATWARLSPVIRASQPCRRAIWPAIRIMLRRISTVNSMGGALSRMHSWGRV